MNKKYLLSFLGVVVSSVVGLSQPIQQQSEGSFLMKERSSKVPFIGVSVGIPLSKLFRSKKSKELAEFNKRRA